MSVWWIAMLVVYSKEHERAGVEVGREDETHRQASNVQLPYSPRDRTAVSLPDRALGLALESPIQ